MRNNSNGWQIAFVTTTASAPRFPADKSYRRGESAFARTTDRCRLAWRRSAARKVASTRWPEGCKRHFVQRFVFRPWVATFATRRHDLPAFGPRQAAATRKQARPTRTRPRERGLHGKCGELQTSALPKRDTSPTIKQTTAINEASLDVGTETSPVSVLVSVPRSASRWGAS